MNNLDKLIKNKSLLHYAAIFLGIAALASIGWFLAIILAGGAVLIAKICFFLFLGLFILFLVMDVIKKHNTKKRGHK